MHVYFLVNISEYMSLWAQEFDLQERQNSKIPALNLLIHLSAIFFFKYFCVFKTIGTGKEMRNSIFDKLTGCAI